MQVSFDDCFQTFPKIHPPKNYQEFWHDAIKELKTHSIKSSSKKILRSSILKESQEEVTFQSANKYNLIGKMIIPRRRGKLPILISIQNYMDEGLSVHKELTEIGIAHLAVYLRGHGKDLVKPAQNPQEPNQKKWTPGYFQKSVQDIHHFYMRYLYLDIIRIIEFVRLNDKIDSSQIILHGKYLGASIALFGAAFSKNVKAIIVEKPNFGYLVEEQLRLNGSWMGEINSALKALKSKKTELKNKLAYFDTLNLSNLIHVPSLFTCNLSDEIANPKAVFAVFNNLNCDKRMHIYPTLADEADKYKQEKVNFDFLKEILFQNESNQNIQH